MLKAMSSKKAAFNFWQTIAMGSVGLWLLVVFDDRIENFVTGKQLPNHLKLEELYYENGKFYQQINPSLGKPKFSFWAADIWRGVDHVCGGSGSSSYKPKTAPVAFTPEAWTGDDCSALIIGKRYTAAGTWSYSTWDGKKYELHKSLEFIHSEVVE